MLLRVICRFNTIFLKIPLRFSREMERKILKFTKNHKRPTSSKAALSRERIDGVITHLDFKLHHKAVVTRAAWCQHKG